MGVAACLGYNGGIGPASGPAPLLSIGVRTVESWSGHALLQIPANEPALLALPTLTPDGKTNLPTAAGTIRLWYAPVDWSTTGAGGNGPGTEAVLWTVGAWSSQAAVGWYSLSINAAGTAIIFRAHGAGQPVEILRAPIEFCAGDWHQLALAWSEKESVLFIDGERAAEGPGVALVPLTKFEGTPGFCIGSSVYGTQSAGGVIEETFVFSRVCSEAELKGDWQRNAPWAARGPISPEEEAQLLKMAEAARMARALAPPPAPTSSGHGAMLMSMGDCAAELGIPVYSTNDGGTVTLTISSPTTNAFDLFRTFALLGDSITNSYWHWLANGTNGQSFTFSARCSPAFFVLGCTNDADGDGLTDVFEVLVNKTSPATNHTLTPLFTDLQLANLLVNDPEQDCGNEQNSQFESSCAVVSNKVIVAYVDSNQGVYGLGADPLLTNRVPRFVGWAVSTNGGLSFQDQGAPLLATRNPGIGDDGDGGDPVLAVDRSSGVVYLAGTSPRNAGKNGIPLWKSTDGGVTFTNLFIVRDDIQNSDKPWITVDDWAGTGQHDVYLACSTINEPFGLWLTVSPGGILTNWTAPRALRAAGGTNEAAIVHSAIVVVDSNHVAYAVWIERTGASTNWLKMRTVQNHTNLGSVQIVRQLMSTGSPYGLMPLKRSNTAAADDTFRTFPFPVVAVNPAKAGHLYVTYADKGTNTNDKADISLVRSTDRGTNWTSPMAVNTVWTNDQWMPVLAVKPDGTQLFMGWYDRRSDTNNSLIDVYGRFGTIATNGSVSLNTEFRINSVSFPPVFAGTLTNNVEQGHYDPVYPPGDVNLHWWYEDWPTNATDVTFPTYIGHVGEYNGAWAEGQYVYMTWTDYRLPSVSTLYNRNQSDIRLVTLTWP